MIDETEALAEAFAAVPRPRRMETCPCCTDAGRVQRLLRTSTWSIDSADLDHYAGKAITTWGTVGDFQYFLPRLLELWTDPRTGDGVGLLPNHLAWKLDYADVPGWPPAARAALRDYLHAALRRAVRHADTAAALGRYAGDWCEAAGAILLTPAAGPVGGLLATADAARPAFRAVFRAAFSPSGGEFDPALLPGGPTDRTAAVTAWAARR